MFVITEIEEFVRLFLKENHPALEVSNKTLFFRLLIFFSVCLAHANFITTFEPIPMVGDVGDDIEYNYWGIS